VVPFPVPAASHAACGFTALRAPAPFTSRVMRPLGSLRRDAQSSSQVLQRDGWVYQSTPAFRLTPTSCAARLLCSTGVTPLRRYYERRRRRLVFGRFPGSPGYTTYLAPPISRRDEDGFSSCSTCPCHRAAPNHPVYGLLPNVSKEVNDRRNDQNRMQSYIRPVVKPHRLLAIMGIRAPRANRRRTTLRVNVVIGLARCRSDRSRHDQVPR
jgi:hypothetical protein